jgi:hypothetical protein
LKDQGGLLTTQPSKFPTLSKLLGTRAKEAKNQGVTELQGSPAFQALSEQEQETYRKVSQRIVQLVQRYAIPLCFAPPLSIGGKVNGGTGCILRLDTGPFIVTANHVLAAYEERRQNEPLNWQFGHLRPFDPVPRIAWRDPVRDIIFLAISEDEVIEACDSTSLVFSAPTGWPPTAPKEGQVALIAGFPRILREVGTRNIEAGPYSAMFRVASVNEGYFYCQIVQEELISFDGGSLPPTDADVGGLSGGPVALMTPLAYPLGGDRNGTYPGVQHSPNRNLGWYPARGYSTTHSVTEKQPAKYAFSRNGYKNGYSDEKEGQPVRAGLLVSPLLSDWCGGGDLNPYALRR